MTELCEENLQNKFALSETLLKENQLNIKRIQKHQKLVIQTLNNKIKSTISIKEPCQIDNGSILAWEQVKNLLASDTEEKSTQFQFSSFKNWKKNHLVTCIPAAGAGARFFHELTKFSSYEELYDCIKALFPDKELAEKIFASAKLNLEKYLEAPKAFIPATLEGDSFLKLKYLEQLDLLACAGNVLIAPAQMKTAFEENLKLIENEVGKEKLDWFILEQGRELSTIRFNMDGTPFVDEDKKYTPVSAGHGELIHLFDPISQHFPKATCLHIRNIDNIIGNSIERANELNVLARCFKSLHEGISYLRVKCLEHTDLTDKASYEILLFISQMLNNDHLQTEVSLCINKNNGAIKIPFQLLYKILSQIFYWKPLPDNCSAEQGWKQIHKLLQRPLSILGVVKKEKNDVGGGPVIAEIQSGVKVKLCMEMPHASEKDAEKYFSSGGGVKHFNPVLAFFELRTLKNMHKNQYIPSGKVNFQKLLDNHFWLLAKREYKGKPVCYYEIVLYELIGNSAGSNLVFVEVPRTLFKPHKSYFDSLGHTRKDYGFVP